MDNPFLRIMKICLRNTPWRSMEELRAAVDERNVNHVQSLFPQELVTLESLCGEGRMSRAYDASAFSMARNQEAVCRSSNCFHCPFNGCLYDVFPREELGKRFYYVDFLKRCPRWLSIQASRRPEEKPVQSAAGIGFGE